MLAALGGIVGWCDCGEWSVRTYALVAESADEDVVGPSSGLRDGRPRVRLPARHLGGDGAAVRSGAGGYLSTLDVNATLKDGGRGAAGGGRATLSRALVIGEMALAVVLLAGAGVMIRSFLNLSTADLGVHTDNVTTMLLSLPRVGIPARPRGRFFDRLNARLDATPGSSRSPSPTTFRPPARALPTKLRARRPSTPNAGRRCR